MNSVVSRLSPGRNPRLAGDYRMVVNGGSLFIERESAAIPPGDQGHQPVVENGDCLAFSPKAPLPQRAGR